MLHGIFSGEIEAKFLWTAGHQECYGNFDNSTVFHSLRFNKIKNIFAIAHFLSFCVFLIHFNSFFLAKS